MNPTALIADDEPLLREILEARLAAAWPELQIVAQARNGRQAIQLFDQHQPAICFLDVHMPGLSGVDAARHVGKRAHLVLVAGDSGVAGVGAPTQDQALCDHLVRCLSRHHTVRWCALAVSGLDSPGLLSLPQETPCVRFDVVVLSIGANDATRLCAPLQWARWQTRLA